MSRYTTKELSEMAKVIMFNPNSGKSKQLIWDLAMTQMISPQQALDNINRLANETH